MEDLTIIAEQYAKRVHGETNHKYNGQPYEVHLQMVYDYACKYINLLLLDNARKHSEVFAAAWTHDVIEDCRQTYNDVKTVLGENVADIVFALTNEKGKTRKDRANDKYYAGIRGTSFAAFVKICDRLANVKYSKEHGLLELFTRTTQLNKSPVLLGGQEKSRRPQQAPTAYSHRKAKTRGRWLLLSY